MKKAIYIGVYSGFGLIYELKRKKFIRIPTADDGFRECSPIDEGITRVLEELVFLTDNYITKGCFDLMDDTKKNIFVNIIKDYKNIILNVNGIYKHIKTHKLIDILEDFKNETK